MLSHDHYDHLDYSTIKRIKDNVNTFVVPYGVGNHLRKWKVEEEKIIELNWNEVYFTALIAIVLSILATLYPAIKAARINPAKVLGH